ncbi:alpha/beta fold hydrolase [Aurantibacter crassamenti]|uniref:YheT family hydrolase n=1 Tax=Aurantibacter crassamenti TaxID=1837375 RepID=UPI001939AE0E|nr:alpha/beta fold hydrolase [Aurantibacter crassamenti]MBM1104924.1 alpha/beta fold hydrolase [Aurantibacter crassamenti]
MPILESNYKPPFLFKNGHISTIYHGLFRKIDDFKQKRERIELPDSDFLDLDWSFSSTTSNKVIILLHGLEGHGQRPYITGSAKAFNEAGYDACAVNFRGCSGETNRLFRAYHSGATEDLDAVVQHIINNKTYSKIYIKGISLGGNMAMKYVGEERNLPKEIKGVVGISVPCDLYSSSKELLKLKNRLYSNRFKKHLTDKLKLKVDHYPEQIGAHHIKRIKTLKDFDDIYTSNAHGFHNALDYYEKSNCLQFLPNIKIPALIINAVNDSFLGPSCYPYKEAMANPYLHLETPEYGGHVGFYGKNNITYTEKRAINFLEKAI